MSTGNEELYLWLAEQSCSLLGPARVSIPFVGETSYQHIYESAGVPDTAFAVNPGPEE